MKKYNMNWIFKQSVLFFLNDLQDTVEHTNFNKEMFAKMDTDGDGMLTKQEIAKGYRTYISHLGGVVSNNYVEELFEVADVDKSGKLNYHEFIAFALDQEVIKSK